MKMKFRNLFTIFLLTFMIHNTTQLTTKDVNALFGTCIISNIKDTDDLNTFLKNNDYLIYSDHFYTRSLYGRSSTIKLVNSSLKTIPDYFFKRFPDAVNVFLANVGLETISSEALILAKNVKFFDVSKNSLTTLQKSQFSNLLAVERIDLEYNQLENIDGVFDNVSRFLKTVNLTYNNIKSIPEEAFSSLTEIETLDIRFNKIEQVGDIQFGSNDSSIGQIWFSNNKIKEFNYKFRSSIVELYLDNNQLKMLPDIQKVRDLDVSNNQLEALTLMEDVEEIKASNNKLKSVIIGRNVNLTYANFANNNLDQKSVSRILEMKDLVYLDLTNSKIGPLNVSTFSSMPKLQRLFLKNTEISNIGFGTLSHQVNLLFLDISNNNLMSIDLDKFSSLTNLVWLSLSGNMLMEIHNSEHIRKVFPKLNEIEINDNDWKCSYLANFMKWCNHAEIAISYKPPLVIDGPNIKGIGCVDVENVKIENVSIAVPNTLPDDYKQTITQLLDAIRIQSQKQIHIPEKQQDTGTTNIFMVVFVCIAAMIVSIFYSIKLAKFFNNRLQSQYGYRRESQSNLHPFPENL